MKRATMWLMVVVAVALSACGTSDPSSNVGTVSGAPATQAGAVVEVQTATGTPGNPVDVCVNLKDRGESLGGVQMDLNWDSHCLTANLNAEGKPDCWSNPVTRKDVYSGLLWDSGLRVVYFSLSDRHTIPDTWLFCCGFTISSSTSSSQCPIDLNNALGSSPSGQPLPIAANAGIISVNATSDRAAVLLHTPQSANRH